MADYYEILEIQRTASDNEIKKAYRRLALKWHPDKNPENLEESNKRFKELSEAYEVLSDVKKRGIYDRHGKEGLIGENGGQRRGYHNREHPHGMAADFDPFGGFSFVFRSPEDVFRDFFGADSPFGDIFLEPQLNAVNIGTNAAFNGSNGSSSGSGSRRRSHPHRSNQHHLANFNMLGGGLQYFDFFSPMAGFSSFSSSSQRGGTDSNGSVNVIKRTSTSTVFKHGKKITTKRVTEGNTETVYVYENDALKSKTVNGVLQIAN